ncbi:malonic semialdehyde reductase [Winogradskya consettensis]|uniref:Nitroreductase family protein n=1 Tax=Winogradskya consettensis TaxID=113560 RepID=A0A919SBG5_9ACTN|nr:malonic semialdehyde reductase [Actinoplanes consettensis]GIM68453.1 nitroreductase family protein [Actinoplanes consettensis]
MTLLHIGPGTADLLFREARSASRFTDEPVSDEQLAAIWELVRDGPTAFNEQPLRMVAVRSPEARARLARHLHGQNRDRAAGAPLSLVLAADLDFHRELPALYPGAQPLFDYMDGLTRDERRETALTNAWLQIGYLIVGVRAAGLAAGPMSGYDTAALNADFFPDGRWESLLVLNVGRPLPKTYARLPRLAHDRVSRSF